MSTARETYAHRTYLETKIRTAPPPVLIFEMLRTASGKLLRIERAIGPGLEPDDWEAVAHVLEILGELNGALRHDLEPALANRLGSLYAYAAESLMSAVVQRSRTGVRSARRVVSSLVDATITTLAAPR